MRPTIKRMYFDYLDGFYGWKWICAGFGDCFSNVVGIGNTPSEAYKDWVTIQKQSA
jgi:hypothetical protein